MNAKIFNLPGLALACLILLTTQIMVTSNADANEIEPETSQSSTTSISAKAFTEQQLYDLLVGELAGVRGDVSLALEKYATQAFAMRDAQLAERAVRIANYSNRPEDVLKLALLWSELAPENPEARRLVALALARKGNFIEAFPHAAFSLQRGNSEPLMTLTILAGRASKEDRAALIEQFINLETSLGKKDFWLSLTKAMLLRSDNQLRAAQKSAARALKITPNSETAALLFSQLQHQLGDKKKAINGLRKSLKRNPDSKKLHIQMVRFVADSDLVAARQLLDDLTERYPDDIAFALSQAQLNLELGLIDDARRNYLRLIQKPAAASQAYFQLGLLEQQQGNFDQAIAYLRLVRAKNYLIPVAARVSTMLSETNRVKTAQLYLQSLRRANPSNAATLFQIESEMLINNAMHQGAYGVLNNAITSFPANIPLLYARSLVSEQLQEFQQAELDLRRIIALDENNAMALNALGYTLTLHSNRYEEAHQLIIRALEMVPEDPATLDSLGWVLFHMKRYQEAIAPLEAAWQKLPDAEIAAHLGEVYWVSGRQQDAEAIWGSILEKQPENPMILETIKRLKQLDTE